MPARSTKSKAASKKPAKAAAKHSSANKRRVVGTAKPVVRKKAANPKPRSKRAAPTRPKPVAKATLRPVAGKPGTITVGDTVYVIGEYGALMTKDDYERVMAKKLRG